MSQLLVFATFLFATNLANAQTVKVISEKTFLIDTAVSVASQDSVPVTFNHKFQQHDSKGSITYFSSTCNLPQGFFNRPASYFYTNKDDGSVDQAFKFDDYRMCIQVSSLMLYYSGKSRVAITVDLKTMAVSRVVVNEADQIK